ncbi:Factor of DNA methylation 4 [Hibiscus syriacus]|uniref:Factor of DNA methylation 4 n=2 Tax=Hibiscus syriacus TaxID=106335 RepID=A0A6A2Y4I8_HIBSY|nr:Factor of DNA methylation 4 [Hibiscus syriacus]
MLISSNVSMCGMTTKSDSLDDMYDEKFVHPWMGIVANIPTIVHDGKHVADSGKKLKEDLAEKGFNPLKVHPLWNGKHGHSGFAIVEFNKEWDGFNNAIMFEKSFDLGHYGKRDYYSSRRRKDKLYAWVAREDDFYSEGLIGKYLRRKGDLKTVSSKEAEDKRKTSKLVKTLTNTLETKNLRLQEMQNKYNEATSSRSTLIQQREDMIKAYNEESKRMQQNAHDHFKKIFLEHERIAQHFQYQQRELEQREKELFQREAQNEAETKKIQHEKMMNERAALEQKKVDETVLKLAEEQKREKEKLHRQIIELEKQLDAKQTLELAIQRMKGALQVMQHMKGDGDAEMNKKMKSIEEELKEKEEELEDLEDLNQALIIKERKSNDELQDARKELITAFRDVSARSQIGVKKMGELDIKPFQTAAKRKYSAREADEKSAELCSLWQEYLRDPSWHPFKIITDKQGNSKEILDEEDKKLIEVKAEFGDEVYGAVTVALKQMNDYNPSGRYIIPELWNFNQGRKATLTEGVQHLLQKWKQLKRKRH